MHKFIMEDNLSKALIAQKEGGLFEVLRKKALSNGHDHAFVYDLESYLTKKIASRDGVENELLLAKESANYALLLTDLNRLPDAVSWYEIADNMMENLSSCSDGADLAAIRTQIYDGLVTCHERLNEKRHAAAYRKKAERLGCILTAN